MTKTIDEALMAILDASPSVKALAGNTPRIYPIKAEENTTAPYAVYSRAGGQAVASMTGQSGLRSTSFDFACWADKPSEALQLAVAIFGAFAAFAGFQADPGEGNVKINSILMAGESDDYNDVTGRVAVVYSFDVWYNDPA